MGVRLKFKKTDILLPLIQHLFQIRAAPGPSVTQMKTYFYIT
jgi:hypothetical protein